MNNYIPLHDISIMAEIPEDEINNTRYSKTSINDLKALVAKHGLDIYKVHSMENLAGNNVFIYKQRLSIIKN